MQQDATSFEVTVETVNILENSFPFFRSFSEAHVGIVIVILNKKISMGYHLCVLAQFYSHVCPV